MRKTLTAALLVCFAASARAEEAKPSPWTFALHGFVSMSGYVQDAKTGLNEGQRALFAAASGEPSERSRRWISAAFTSLFLAGQVQGVTRSYAFRQAWSMARTLAMG